MKPRKFVQRRTGFLFKTNLEIRTSKIYENIEGKGRIARYEQFILFPQCFLYRSDKLSPIFTSLEIVVWELFQFETIQTFVV